MAEALLGLAPSSYGDAPSNKFAIATPDDLPAQLHRTLETKKTPTRCEHVSVTLDIPSTVEFAIRDGDADAQDNIDPTLSGIRSQMVEGQPARIVRAYETIINQPQNNPVTQKAVAKHITGLLSTVDESTWVVREVSRSHYGWTFTYVCRDSIAMWNRQNGKAATKALIGEYSQKELDPVISGRPAFDCRGTLTIAFSKNTRTISVKYEHTPLHRTVGEMIEHFRPLPPASPPAPLIPAGGKKKTPRKRKSAVNEDGTPAQSKKKRKSAFNEDGTPAEPKKKRKKKSEAAAQGSAEDAAAGSGAATVPTKADVAVQSDMHSHAVLNVPPAEAARRRETAIRVLTESGVDPESLSTEQFSIFANQSPELQKESLAMLIKYGAERLRIVHPSDAAASSASASPVPLQASTQPGAADTSASAPPETPVSETKKKRPRKSKTAAPGGGDADDELIPAPAGTPWRQVSRGSCISCRTSRAKCDRSKPTCDVCEEEGLDCQYPLIKGRAVKKTVVQVVDDDDDDAEADVEAEPAPEPEQEEKEPDDIETIDYTSNMPVANMLTPAVEAPHQDYFNAGPSELTYSTQTATNDLAIAPGVTSYPTSSATVNYTDAPPATTAFPQPSLTEAASFTQPVVSETVHYSQPAVAETTSYTQTAAKSPTVTRTRRSLPSGQRREPVAESPVPLPTYAQNWQAASPPKVPVTVSPTMTARQSRSRKSTQTPAPATYNNAQQIAAHSAMQQQQQQQQQQRPSPKPQMAQTVTPSQVSPFQAPVQAARAKSRTGQRASTRTPVNTEGWATPSHHTMQPATQTTMGATTYNDAQSASNATNYNTYNGKHSGTNNSQADTRVPYEPYAAQNTAGTSTYPSYDSYERNNSTAQNTNISYTPGNNSRSGQWSAAEPRDAQTFNNSSNTTTTSGSSSYTQQPTTTQQPSASLQSFNMRASATSNHARSSSTKYSQQQQQQQPQQQPQSYSSYPSQTQQQSAQPDPHSWYGFGASSTSFTPANNSGGYSTRNSTSNAYGSGAGNQAYQQQHHGSLNMPGHSYAGQDSDLYDLLKIHNSGR